ncbi:MAG: DMT family transporter [Pseudomonadota bacterium]|uniref:DMT family transporter n=1 Tax=Caldimonas aquatica TaxID=376175 RepID=A0ABY6MQS0_9BURK|nr:DMT family transporter [Schlegelella aquatica]UZD54358.1 DMT family transporter [Schlegelella aquatica]
MSRYLSAPHLYALGAIALWASLATLGVALSHLPPFLLTGLSLLIGSLPAWPRWREWRIPGPTVALGLYGLFGYHFLLFIALRDAPPVEANLVNYLWPLLIVVLSPVLLPGLKLHAAHLGAALVGFAGAALAIAGGRQLSGELSWGYLAALGSAIIWASYSLLTKRVPRFPTAAIGLFGLVSGLLSLLCHALLEEPVALTARDWVLVTVMGLGPLGAAFFLWDRALKDGDPRTIGILSYVTPLGSTLMLMLFTGRAFSPWVAGAAALIVGAAVVGMRARG